MNLFSDKYMTVVITKTQRKWSKNKQAKKFDKNNQILSFDFLLQNEHFVECVRNERKITDMISIFRFSVEENRLM